MRGKFGSQFKRLGSGTIGNKDFGRLFIKQRQQCPPHGTTGAEEQHALAGETETQVVGDIPHDAETIGVVAENRTVRPQREGIHRTRSAATRGQFIGHLESLQLEWHGDVHAFATRLLECTHGGDKPIEFAEDRAIFHVLPALSGKGHLQGR